ncbi:hypothetical protein JOC86_004072 [Bacillus pakistanensis]|uniref:Uncharacterized protein n=1 Tax=Rossellomorea pakistanensis TaxID=992288 RepID=A0ABS2NI06_9BACI|nr:hypothetical protein [Bacillus pakistanensis]MBM7587499.1 hypothetical protein [Bacillus pakistanensis]
MPRENENSHVESTPHFDGEKEGIINDSTASAGETIGIQVDTKGEFKQERNPFHYVPEDEEMKRFGELMGGNKVKDQESR